MEINKNKQFINNSMLFKLEDFDKLRGINLVNNTKLNNVVDLNQLILKVKEEILNNIVFEQVSFHTLTFNIEKISNQSVKNLTNLVEKYLKIIKSKKKKI